MRIGKVARLFRIRRTQTLGRRGCPRWVRRRRHKARRPRPFLVSRCPRDRRRQRRLCRWFSLGQRRRGVWWYSRRRRRCCRRPAYASLRCLPHLRWLPRRPSAGVDFLVWRRGRVLERFLLFRVRWDEHWSSWAEAKSRCSTRLGQCASSSIQ
jgi:hypothetical protein